jgi:hypothetical protein
MQAHVQHHDGMTRKTGWMGILVAKPCVEWVSGAPVVLRTRE